MGSRAPALDRLLKMSTRAESCQSLVTRRLWTNGPDPAQACCPWAPPKARQCVYASWAGDYHGRGYWPSNPFDVDVGPPGSTCTCTIYMRGRRQIGPFKNKSIKIHSSAPSPAATWASFPSQPSVLEITSSPGPTTDPKQPRTILKYFQDLGLHPWSSHSLLSPCISSWEGLGAFKLGPRVPLTLTRAGSFKFTSQ